MDVLKYIVIALIGGLAAILANKGMAVFNDGFRPIYPEYFEGRLNRKQLAATCFAISFGLVIGFGLPTSIAANIILIHCILLGTDIIGVFCPDSKLGTILAGAIGAVYGIGLLVGLQVIIDVFAMLPIDFLSALGQVSTPIVVAFSIFPAVTVGLQFGFKPGMITAVITLLVRQLVTVFGKIPMGDKVITLNADGMALLVGMIILIVMAARDKSGADDANTQLVTLFEEKVKRIRGNWFLLAIMGGLLAAGTSFAMIAGDPVSLNLLAEGKNAEAALSAFARGIGFIPLIATTAITTGVYAPAGMTFVFAIGLAIGNPLIAFVLGAICMTAEVFLLTYVAKFLDKFPGVRRCADNIRTAMSRVLDVALLIGGMMAAYAIGSGLGLLIVIGFYCLNKTSKKPVVEMAIGPIGAIATGLIVNILHVIGLFPVA